MKRTYIKDLTEGEHLIKGYVETIRDKKIMFLVIRDVTGFVQVTIEKIGRASCRERVCQYV